MPSESPTIRTRSGSVPVGCLGLAAIVVAVTPVWDLPRESRGLGGGAIGPTVVRPLVPPGRLPSRPVAETMCDSPSARLSAATGPTVSRLMVRRVPTGETCALCCSVGAKRRNHTANAATPSASTWVQRARTRPSGGVPVWVLTLGWGGTSVVIRSGSR